MTYTLADTATPTSAPTTTPVQEDSRAPPRSDRQLATQATSSDMDTTVRKRPTRSSSQASPGLSNSLYGQAPVAFMGTSDYRTSAGSSQGDELEPMNSEEDIARMCDLIQSFPVVPKESFRCALNKRFTKSNLVHCLSKLRQLFGPRFYYLGGHAEWCEERGEFDYLFGPDAKGGNVNDPARRISSKELSALLVDPASPIPTQMILITDFCNSFNFLHLPWTLRRAANRGFFWEKSEDCVPGAWSADRKILQFASGERGATTYSFESCGSIFTREFYNAEHTGEGSAKAPVSLLERMGLIYDGIDQFLKTYNSKNSPAIRQVPQAYASHPFDLDDPNTLPDLLLSL